ncbi:thioredoxin family protein [bacterium]|nr:thioredoxin family protein [bacterium]
MKKILVLLVFVLIPFVFSAEELSESEVFYFFYSSYCPHCHEAMPFVEELEKERPDITFKKLEVSEDEVNRALFRKKSEKLGIKGSGVPTFVFKDKYIVGFKKGTYEKRIRAMIGKPAQKPVKK